MNICHIAIQIYNVRIRRATPSNKIKTINIKYIDKDKSKYTHKHTKIFMNICHIAVQIYNVRTQRATPYQTIKQSKKLDCDCIIEDTLKAYNI